MSYRIGERVRVSMDFPEGNKKLLAGTEGTVVDISDMDPPIGVDWDIQCSHHNCCGKAKEAHGWYVREYQIEPAFEEIDTAIPVLTVEDLYNLFEEEIA